MLGHDEFGINDNFFAIGGHSLAASLLVSRIEQRFGRAPSLAVLLQNPTIAMLAPQLLPPDPEADPELLTRSTLTRRAADPCFVALQREGQAAPIFVIHGHRGEVFCYAAFANALAPNRPVYGLQARGIDGRDERHRSLEEMAEHYADLIESHHPHGVVHLLGQSAGGWHAWAVGSVLLNRGHSLWLGPAHVPDPVHR